VAARGIATHQIRWIRHDTESDDPDGYESFLAAGDAEDLDLPVDDDLGVLIIYTAAFGGRPNGAVLSHRACIAQGVVHGAVTGTTGDDVYLKSGPMFNLGPL